MKILFLKVCALNMQAYEKFLDIDALMFYILHLPLQSKIIAELNHYQWYADS